MNHIDSERIHGISAYVVTVNARNQDLAFVIVDKETADHFDQVSISFLQE
jgi:hypothetical protein